MFYDSDQLQTDGVVGNENEHYAGEIQVYEFGSALQLTSYPSSRDRIKAIIGAGSNQVDYVRTPGQRDKVIGHSQGSIRRYFQAVGKIDMRCPAVTFMLTYPDPFPCDPVTWRKHQNALRSALDRKFREGGRGSKPTYAALWYRHFEDRKSGSLLGERVVHLHIVLWPNGSNADFKSFTKGWKQEFGDWIRQAWYKIVKSNNEDHLRNGVKKIFVLRRQSDVLRFLRYLAGPKNRTPADVLIDAYPDGTGRTWGFWNDENLPLSPKRTVRLTPQQYIVAQRLMQSYIWPEVHEGSIFSKLNCMAEKDGKGFLVALAQLPEFRDHEVLQLLAGAL